MRLAASVAATPHAGFGYACKGTSWVLAYFVSVLPLDNFIEITGAM